MTTGETSGLVEDLLQGRLVHLSFDLLPGEPELASASQTPGRIQKVELPNSGLRKWNPPILDSNTPMV